MISIEYRPRIESEQKFQYQTRFSSGADLIAQEHVAVMPSETTTIKTGVFVTDFSLEDLEHGYIPELQVRPRSGKSKQGILLHLGTVDPDFRQEIGVTLTNVSSSPFYISPGDRIAQLVCAMVYRPPCIPVADRQRDGGFGSTGG